MDEIGAHLKAAYPHALATLTRVLGDLDSAEDALQEAAARAVEAWRKRGLPDQPVAWLVRSGRNCAVDAVRRRRVEDRHRADLARAPAEDFEADSREAVLGMHLEDDFLRLIFTCCHPALAREEQVALTLRTVGGLELEEIAAAFLTRERAMEQRLTRAKRKIRAANVPYEAPRPEDLPVRLEAVRTVVYLVFNEGYKASAGDVLIRVDLCGEAIRLARVLVRTFPGDPETLGLLALVLLHDARRAARATADGAPITLDEQDRSRWDRARIAEGRAVLEKALRHGRPGPYQVQAAISAVHGEAASIEGTDWDEIVHLYEVLEDLQPSPVVTLNRAVALAQRDGAAAGLELLSTLAGRPEIERYLPYEAARAALLAQDGQTAAACSAYRRAARLAQTAAERAYMLARAAALGA